MDKLGRRLRGAREAKGSTLGEAEAVTHIRADFLELLEAGDFAAFPGGDVQVRGFLRIYARYLDLPPRDVLGRYNAEVHGATFSPAEAEQEEAPPEPADPPDDLTAIRFRPRDIPVTSSLPRWMSVKTVMIVGLVLTVLLAVVALVTYLLNRPGNEIFSTSLTTVASAAVEEVSMITPAPDQPTPTFPASSSDQVTVALEATEHVQVRVSRGGRVVFEGMMAPGHTEAWTDDDMIMVETGNGAALQVTINGTAVGTMCGRGQLCTRAWEPSGELNPP